MHFGFHYVRGLEFNQIAVEIEVQIMKLETTLIIFLRLLNGEKNQEILGDFTKKAEKVRRLCYLGDFFQFQVIQEILGVVPTLCN